MRVRLSRGWGLGAVSFKLWSAADEDKVALGCSQMAVMRVPTFNLHAMPWSLVRGQKIFACIKSSLGISQWELPFPCHSEQVLCISYTNFKFSHAAVTSGLALEEVGFCPKFLVFHRLTACMSHAWSYPPWISLAHLFQQKSSPGVGQNYKNDVGWHTHGLELVPDVPWKPSPGCLALMIKLLLIKTDTLGQLSFVFFDRENRNNPLWCSDQVRSGVLHRCWRQRKPPPHHFGIDTSPE